MKKCYFCGEMNPDNTIVCPRCGRRDPNIDSPSEKNEAANTKTEWKKVRICPKCSYQNDINVWSCKKCREVLSVKSIAEVDEIGAIREPFKEDKDSSNQGKEGSSFINVVCPYCSRDDITKLSSIRMTGTFRSTFFDGTYSVSGNMSNELADLIKPPPEPTGLIGLSGKSWNAYLMGQGCKSFIGYFIVFGMFIGYMIRRGSVESGCKQIGVQWLKLPGVQ